LSVKRLDVFTWLPLWQQRRHDDDDDVGAGVNAPAAIEKALLLPLVVVVAAAAVGEFLAVSVVCQVPTNGHVDNAQRQLFEA